MATLIKTAILTIKDFDSPTDLVRSLIDLTDKGYEVVREDLDMYNNIIIVLEQRTAI